MAGWNPFQNPDPERFGAPLGNACLREKNTKDNRLFPLIQKSSINFVLLSVKGNTVNLKVLSSEMDPAEIRLIR